MEIVFILVPATFLLAFGALAAYVWSAHDGQFDDLDTPPMRMLHDDEAEKPTVTESPDGSSSAGS